MNWTIYNIATGALTGQQYSGPDDHLGANVPPGHAAVPGQHDHTRRRVDLATGQVVPWQPPAPPDDEWRTWSWDAQAEQWTSAPTLATHRLQAWERIKRARAVAETAPILVGRRAFDADPVSQQRIAVAAQMALLAMSEGQGAAWSITWTLADNTSVELDADAAIDLGRRLARQINTAHQHARALRSQIDAAQSLAELDMITWS